MRFRILGPLEVWSEGRWTAISASKWRSLLACLLLQPGHLWSTESLILELWGDNPPANSLKNREGGAPRRPEFHSLKVRASRRSALPVF